MSEFNSIAGAATAFESWLSRKRGSFASDVIEMQADVCMMAVHELALNKSYLWTPADMITFVPQLLTTIYGDGRALWHLATINQRPAFYVVRGDSAWVESNWSSEPEVHFSEMIDRIYGDLEYEFGRAELDSEEDDPEILAEGKNPWPAFDAEGGCSWAQVGWPKQFDRMVQRSKTNGWRCRSILRREYAVEDQFARLADDGCPHASLRSDFG